MIKLATKKFWLESKFLQISFWQRMASQLNLLLSKIVKNDLQKDLTVTKLRLWSFKLHTLFIHLFLPYHLSLGVVQWLRGPNFALFGLPPTYGGQTWTFKVPPTFCPRGQFQNPPSHKVNPKICNSFFSDLGGDCYDDGKQSKRISLS